MTLAIHIVNGYLSLKVFQICRLNELTLIPLILQKNYFLYSHDLKILEEIMKIPQHDFAPGKIECCQVCGSKNLKLIVDLGHQPLCDSLLDPEDLNKPETYYPLRQFWCKDCSLNQIDYVVDGSTVYHKEYPYRSGITKELAVYQEQISDELTTMFKVSTNDLVVDIGSNDGTLLKGFKKKNIRTLGVEPTNIAKIAQNENGIETIQSFFTENTANEIVKNFGKAKIITTTNVFAHMATLGEVVRGVYNLLADDGIFMIENHYLLQVLQKNQFDTIYHEHLRTYSLRSLMQLFSYYNMTVVDVRQVDRYGGNIRIYVSKNKTATTSQNVKDLIALEESAGLYKEETYTQFAKNTYKIRDELLTFIGDAKKQGKRIVGNSCPGRCSTLLNFCGIDSEMIHYLAEQPTSLKLGKFLPGKHIPVISNQVLFDEQPDYVILMAWHYSQPIIENLRSRGLKSKFVIPFPNLQVV